MKPDYITLENLERVYEEEIKKKVKNKKRIYQFELYKMQYLVAIKNNLLNGSYNGGDYHLFIIKRPKLRLIMSQSMYDKVANHFITRYILEPKFSKYLTIRNTATRKNMGTGYAIDLFKKYLEYYKKYDNIYILKLDISKYFYTIDHEVLLNLLKNDLNEFEYDLLKKVINSTNKDYINRYVNSVNLKYDNKISRYEVGKGLPIGNMSSQFLAIYYLSNLHHYMEEKLGLFHYIVYMDDYVIIHHDMDYLKKCLYDIASKLENEYKLKANKNKTYIKNVKYGVDFLGYNFRIINKKTIIKLTSAKKQKIKKELKKLKYERKNEINTFADEFSKIINYKNSFKYINKKSINDIIDEYWY